MSRKRNLNPQRALVAEYLDRFDGHGRPRFSVLAAGLLTWLGGKAEGGDVVALSTLEAIRQDGALSWVRKSLDQRRFWADPRNGEVLGARRRAGIRARDDNGAPLAHFQQPFFVALTRDELLEKRQAWQSERNTFGLYIALANRILRAWEDRPHAVTVGEVCELAGIELPAELFGKAVGR